MATPAHRRPRVAVDMDGVLADAELALLGCHEAETGRRIERDGLLRVPERDLRRWVETPGFFRRLPLIPGSVEGVRTLMETFEVFIVSAATEFPLSLHEKHEWLGEHFPFIPWTHVVFCGDKTIIQADYLIDDHPRNLDPFQGVPLMFTACQNRLVDRHRRVNDWGEVLRYFEGVPRDGRR